MPAVPDLSGWLRLAQTAGVGPDTARRLLSAFGLPENIFDAGHDALCGVVSPRVAQALLASLTIEAQTLIGRTLQWAAETGNQVITLADAAYPQRLLEIPDPPILLYAKGNAALLAARCMAVVGSRNATAQGIANAAQFAGALADAGWTVVSGLALGVDTAAHRGSLDALQKAPASAGSTVAVIGTGADIVYPARNRALAHAIAEAGCIVSEYPLGMPAIATNFPRRNRIISGLAHGVLVIEAAAQSGSLITARMAAEQNRDVFAIPGSIHSPLSKGCHQLIRQGAKLVESAQDILDELQPAAQADVHAPRQRSLFRPLDASTSTPALPIDLGVTADPVLQAMGFDPVSQDLLGARCGLDSATLSTRLLHLELQGHVALLPGGAYQRLA